MTRFHACACVNLQLIQTQLLDYILFQKVKMFGISLQPTIKWNKFDQLITVVSRYKND